MNIAKIWLMNSREEGKRIIKVGTEDFYNIEATLLTIRVMVLIQIPKHGIYPVVIYCPGHNSVSTLAHST